MSYVDPESAAAAEEANGKPLEHGVDPSGDTEVTHVADTQQVGGADDEAPQRIENPVFDQRANIAARFKEQRQQREERIVEQQEEMARAEDAPAAAAAETGT